MGVRSSLLYPGHRRELAHYWPSILERREEREMVDSHSESYAVQERELQKRLPTVPPSVIRHSVREHRGNIEECYQKLRMQTPQPLSPDIEPFFHNRTPTVSTSRPSHYHQLQSYQPQQPHHYQQRPLAYQHHHPPPPSQQNDHRAVRRQHTWDPYSQTLPNPRRSHTHVHQPPLDPGHYNMYGGAGTPNAETGYHDFRWSGYDSNASTRQVYDRQWTLPRKRDVNFGVTAVSIFAAQEQQLEALQRHHEGQLQQLTYMRQTLEHRQHHLSRLRMDVSAIPSPEQMGELEEVIQTLEIDLREARNHLQVQTVQSKMKEEQDLYTDEGVRWYCEDCSFLNHPLMTLCEKCSIPRARSAS